MVLQGKLTLGDGRVRLHGEAEGIGGTRAVRDAGTASDGKEIVAVFSDNYKARSTKLAKFRFLGTGTTGHLGPRFAVMAVTTALRIWNEERPYRMKGPGYEDADRDHSRPKPRPPPPPPPPMPHPTLPGVMI